MNKKYLLITCYLVSTLLFVSKSNCQSYIDPELKTIFNQVTADYQNFKKPLKDSNNEIEVTISIGFLIYKTFVSSQDIPRCIFTPSCSEFAVEAFQKKGLFTGGMASFDRLTRCHGFVNHSHYSFIKEKKLYYDPVN